MFGDHVKCSYELLAVEVDGVAKSPLPPWYSTAVTIVRPIMALVTSFRLVDTWLMAVGGLECLHRRAAERSDAWSVIEARSDSRHRHTDRASVWAAEAIAGAVRQRGTAWDGVGRSELSDDADA